MAALAPAVACFAACLLRTACAAILTVGIDVRGGSGLRPLGIRARAAARIVSTGLRHRHDGHFIPVTGSALFLNAMRGKRAILAPDTTWNVV
jgi:hypothetical protein